MLYEVRIEQQADADKNTGASCSQPDIEGNLPATYTTADTPRQQSRPPRQATKKALG